MATDPTRNPRGETPNTDSSLSEPVNPIESLTEQLGSVVDDIRQIAVDLGQRPYKIHAVRVKWTGGEIGRGKPETVFDQPILPTPRVLNIDQLDRATQPSGTTDKGNIRLDKISPRYTEDEIKYYFSTKADLGKDEQGFIEIYADERDGQTERKRYVVSKTPYRRANKFDWTVVLKIQDEKRLRNKTIREPRETVWR